MCATPCPNSYSSMCKLQKCQLAVRLNSKLFAISLIIVMAEAVQKTVLIEKNQSTTN